MRPLIDLRDQVALPGQAVHLPGAQGAQAREQRDSNHPQDDQGGFAARITGGVAGVSVFYCCHQGIFRMSCVDMGIILEFK
ncbi:hypothetical protein D3C78_1443230 [compost metagenome]